MLERMSYILNINKSLKIIFTNKDSVNNWVRKPNSHPFFNGSSAMDVMLNGNIADLYNVAVQVKAWWRLFLREFQIQIDTIHRPSAC